MACAWHDLAHRNSQLHVLVFVGMTKTISSRVTHIVLLCVASAALTCAAEPPRIFFNRIGLYRASLFIANADGSAERALFAPGTLDYNGTWSRDGRWIAFTSERNGSADLYRARPDGTGLERLTDDPAFDDQAAFSPNGSQIVFVSTRAAGRANLWILNVATRKARPLTSGQWGDFRPSWSPDGNWIAFSSDRGHPMEMAKGRWEALHVVDIYVMRVDGSGLKRISEQGDSCGSPKWSGDSRQVIAYCMPAEASVANRVPGFAVVDTRVEAIDITTGMATPIASGPGVKFSPAWLPSGEVAYFRKDKSVRGIFYSSGGSGPSGTVGSPSWSPDGTKIVYQKTLPDRLQYWEDTWSRDPTDRLVLTGPMPAFDSSGEQFVISPGGPFDATLVIVQSAEKAGRVAFRTDGKGEMGAQWSPHGDALFFGLGNFFLRMTTGAQVATINADGSGMRELTTGTNNNGFPSPSPDGKRLVYRTTGSEGQGLRILNIESGEITSLTTEYDTFPTWSPRGDIIAFTRLVDGDYELFSIRPDGKDLRRLTNSPGNDSHCSFSPDGEWIAFTSARMGYKDEAVYSDAPQPYGEIFVMRYDGSQVRQLTDNQWEDGTPAWQPMRSR
jgi:TolB protein